MNAGCGGSRECPVPQFDEIYAALLALFGMVEDFLRLKIHEAEAHGAMAHDSFEMSLPSATAELLFAVQADNGVPALPNAIHERIAAKADAIAQSPDTYEPVEVAARRRHTRGDHIRIVEYRNRNRRRR